MPLVQSASKEAFKENIKRERGAGKPMKQSLAIAYSTKRANMKKKKSYAEGGAVDAEKPLHSTAPEHNEDLDMVGSPASLPSYHTESSEDASDQEEDLPRVSEALSLAAEVMKDRKRVQMMSKGGVAEYQSEPDHTTKDTEMGMYMDNDADETGAPDEDTRDSRGLNISQTHAMEDDEHSKMVDSSDASLVGQILSERKARRRNKY